MLKLVSIKIEHVDHARTGLMAREERQAQGLTQKAVADLMGLTEPYVCDLERGRRNWRPDLVEQFNNALRGIKT